MQDLRLVGVHDDGTHLLLEGADGTRLRLPLDDALRAAVRQDRSRLGQLQIELDGGLRPRDVQALVRAGATADDVAARAGWTVEKVRRYEGPILAERAHVADLARLVRMRTRAGGSDAPTLAVRVGERMRARDVDPTTSTWDSWRDAEAEHWTVVMRFVAGGRERRALWTFEQSTQTVTPLDDEARWLTEEEAPVSSGPIPGPAPLTRVQTTVYDVEAEGGVSTPTRRAADGSVDLVTAMRERSQARGRRSRKGCAPTDVPTPESPTDALPISGLTYDPDVHGLPPAAHPRPGDDSSVPEPGQGPDATPAPADADGSEGTTAPPLAQEPAHTDASRGEAPATPVPAAGDTENPLGPRCAAAGDTDASAGDTEAAVGDTGASPGDTEAAVGGAPGSDDPDGPKDPPGEEAAATEPHQPDAKSRPNAKEQPRLPAPDAAEATRPAARRGRPQVPSWDDIMFGARRD